MHSAVAVPLGNFKRCCTKKWSLSGTARNTPKYATDIDQLARPKYENSYPSNANAGIGPINPADMVIDPAAEATVCATFASSMENASFGLIKANKPMDMHAAKTDPACDHPVFNPTETFMEAMIIPTIAPEMIARTVNALFDDFNVVPEAVTNVGVGA